MRQILILSVIFPTSLFAHCQNHSWMKILQTADSVYIISHGLTTGTSISALDSSGKEINQPLFINGKLNDRIVERKKRLTSTGVKQLISILRYKSKESADEAKCYVPEHAIIIQKGKRLSYIEMSFGCQIYNTSEDILLPPIKNRTWTRLIAFFNAHGVQ